MGKQPLIELTKARREEIAKLLRGRHEMGLSAKAVVLSDGMRCRPSYNEALSLLGQMPKRTAKMKARRATVNEEAHRRMVASLPPSAR